MEKDQLDSLATVAVGSEKIPPPPHSHYAPSEVYSSSESPPAYSRPVMKSTAVQIARIIAITLISMSLIIGSFILAAAFLEAHASCTPESIAAMQAQLNNQQQGESFRKLQPEALVQEPQAAKENPQTLSPVTEKELQTTPKEDKKTSKDDSDTTKPDNESGDENENDDDYDDPEFPPVHIKLPLQLDLDDLAGTIMQQAKSLVSCVVERRRSDELTDGDNSLDSSSNDPKKLQRLRGERVAILCESGDPRRQEQEQDLLTPIIVPLGPLPMPMQQQDQDYHRYQVPNQFPIPENQRPPFNFRGINPMGGVFPPEFKNVPQMMDMGPRQPRPQMDIRPMPIELRPVSVEMIQGMRPPSNQEHQQHVFPQEQTTYPQDQQPHGMVPPPPPPPQTSQELPQEHRMVPQVISIRQQLEQSPESQESQERPVFPFQGIPLEIRRIIQQVPLEIKNIIQHITGESRPVPVPEGARREPVQEFKPFPEGPRPIPLDSLMLPIEVRNLLEHGNIEGRRSEESEEQQDDSKSFSGPESQGEEEEKKIPVPADVRNFIHQIVEGRAFPVPRFPMPMRPVESLEVPMQVSAQVSDSAGVADHKEQQTEEQAAQQPQTQALAEQPEESEDKRPHYVQPRSVRSIPEALAHPRDKRTRRCACDCAC